MRSRRTMAVALLAAAGVLALTAGKIVLSQEPAATDSRPGVPAVQSLPGALATAESLQEEPPAQNAPVSSAPASKSGVAPEKKAPATRARAALQPEPPRAGPAAPAISQPTPALPYPATSPIPGPAGPYDATRPAAAALAPTTATSGPYTTTSDRYGGQPPSSGYPHRGGTAYSPNTYADYAWPYVGGPNETDPEMLKLVQDDSRMAQETAARADMWRQASEPAKKAELKSELEELAKQHFDVRQQRRELELKRLQAQLERVRSLVTKRTESRDLIIRRHVAQLLGEEDDLAF